MSHEIPAEISIDISAIVDSLHQLTKARESKDQLRKYIVENKLSPLQWILFASIVRRALPADLQTARVMAYSDNPVNPNEILITLDTSDPRQIGIPFSR